MTKTSQIWLFLALASLSTGSSAAILDIQQLKTLTESGNMSAAYALATENLNENEGDPEFDYYYGIAAIDTGHASQGVFALERVVLANPDHHAARLELARGYFILEEFARSKQEFLTVLEAEPPEDVVVKINAFIDAIRLQEGRYFTTTGGFFELGYGSDSNVSNGPADAVHTTVLGDTTLNDTSIEQKDKFTTVRLNASVNTPVSASVKYYASFDAHVRKNTDYALYDTQTLTLDTGFNFLQGDNIYTANLIAQQFELDGEDYRKLSGFGLTWKNQLTQSSLIQVYTQINKQDFFEQQIKNVKSLTIGTSFSSRFNATLSPVLFANIYTLKDTPELDSDAAKENSERDATGLSLGSILSTSAKTSLQFSATQFDSDYTTENTGFGAIRSDSNTTVAMDFNWLLNKELTLKLYITSIKNDSNISIYTYDKNITGFNLRNDFN